MAHPFDPATTTTHHEFSLYAYIPSAVYPQLLRVLSSLTLTKPAEYTSHHLVWRPAYRSVAPPNPQSAISRAPELYYIQLVAAYEEGKSPREQRWTIRLEDTPEVTRKPVVSRQVLEAGTGEGDVVTFMGALGYTLQQAYFCKNARVVHGNVVFTLSHVCSAPPGEDGLGVAAEMKAVDPDGAWMLKAAVRVASATDAESGNRAVEELRKAKELLKGVCELEVVDRLALETRVRDQGPLR